MTRSGISPIETRRGTLAGFFIPLLLLSGRLEKGEVRTNFTGLPRSLSLATAVRVGGRQNLQKSVHSPSASKRPWRSSFFPPLAGSLRVGDLSKEAGRSDEDGAWDEDEEPSDGEEVVMAENATEAFQRSDLISA